MILPKSYVDSTLGVRPGKNESSFNNIIYAAWYHIARSKQGNFNQSDLDALVRHINLNDDGHGLYRPKNSHDNITYKMILCKVFHLDDMKHASFFRAAWSAGLFRPWDVITYGAVFGPKLLRPLFRLFLFIPAIQMLQAIKSEGKVKPGLINRKEFKKSRIFWWFFKKTYDTQWKDPTGTMIHKQWIDYKGQYRTTQHMQNDGKHLAVFRLYAFKDQFFTFKLTAKIARKMLIKKFGKDYTYELIDNYFQDRNHPVIKMWKGYGDIL